MKKKATKGNPAKSNSQKKRKKVVTKHELQARKALANAERIFKDMEDIEKYDKKNGLVCGVPEKVYNNMKHDVVITSEEMAAVFTKLLNDGLYDDKPEDKKSIQQALKEFRGDVVSNDDDLDIEILESYSDISEIERLSKLGKK